MDSTGEISPDVFRLVAELALGLAPDKALQINTPEPIAAGATTVVFEVWPTPHNVLRLPPQRLPKSVHGWEGFTLGLLGFLVDPDGKPAHGPSLSFYDQSGKLRIASLWRQWARHKESPLIAEQLWLPDFPELCAIKGLEQAHTSDQLRIAGERGVPLVRGMELELRRVGRRRIEEGTDAGKLELARRGRLLKQEHCEDPSWTWVRICYELGMVPDDDEPASDNRKLEQAARERLRQYIRRLEKLEE